MSLEFLREDKFLFCLMTEMIAVSGNASDLAADSAFLSTLINLPQERPTRKRNEGSSSFYSKVLH